MIEEGSWSDQLSKSFLKMEDDLCSGLLYTHSRITDNTKKILESTSFLYGLIELLKEKGFISIEELDNRKREVAERLVKKFAESGVGLMYQDPEHDKYTFEHEARLDCLSRLPICKSICCKFPFALSRQDVEEGIIRWNFSKPYLIAHGGDGYCVHMERNSHRCTVYERRPVPCRGFDCQNNGKWKVWADYEKQIMNPQLIEQINETNGKLYTYSK